MVTAAGAVVGLPLGVAVGLGAVVGPADGDEEAGGLALGASVGAEAGAPDWTAGTSDRRATWLAPFDGVVSVPEPVQVWSGIQANGTWYPARGASTGGSPSIAGRPSAGSP